VLTVPLPRAFALMQTEDQWMRAYHDNTALDAGVIQLAAVDETSVGVSPSVPAPAAGLAFDPQCRLYHSFPDQGRVVRQLWAAPEPGDPLDLLAADPPALSGDFHSASDPLPVLREPRGLAVDPDGRLFIGETAARRILVFDLWSLRLLRRAAVPGRPIDLAGMDHSVLALLSAPGALVRLEAHTGPRLVPLPTGLTDPARVALSPDGEIFVLDQARTAIARVVSSRHSIATPFATDLEFLPGPVLVVARLPREDFLQFRIGAASTEEMPPLKARDYDGLGIVRTPDHRIGFFTSRGFRHAVPARVKYQAAGRVVTYRLDSGAFRSVWGRLFLDACIPKDTDIRVSSVTADDPPDDEDTLPRRLPANVTEATIVRPDLSPPMPPESLAPITLFHPLHRRESGRELPFAPRPANDPFQTYEAPILAGPGRYLWVGLRLTGNTRFTPRVRSLRAEYPSHDYLRRLPKAFSRDEPSAEFLRRYLALFDGFLGELDARATARHAILDAAATPAEALAWLAGFVGLVLDERWPVPVQRAILAEAAWLFRFRGTVPGLARFLSLYLGNDVILIEKFRLRGLGEAGEPGGQESRAILGAGFRVGGALAQETSTPLSGSVADAFDTHAHRFSVIIRAVLTSEQVAVVHRILDVHRPAHTLVDVCTVDTGSRVGRALHVGLTAIVGRSGGFTMLQTGSSFLGRSSIIGRPDAGTRVDSSRLGRDSDVG
jgi:phage tail-like protein